MQAIDIIRDRIGPDPVTVGLVLGSGLGHLVQAVDGVAIDYAELPGFPQAGVSGHSPKLVAGTLEGARVIVLGDGPIITNTGTLRSCGRRWRRWAILASTG